MNIKANNWVHLRLEQTMMNTQRENILPSQDEESVFWMCCCSTKSHKDVVQLQGRIKSPASNSELGSAHPHTLAEGQGNSAEGQGMKTDPQGLLWQPCPCPPAFHISGQLLFQMQLHWDFPTENLIKTSTAVLHVSSNTLFFPSCSLRECLDHLNL